MSIEACAARRAVATDARETLHRRGQRLVLAIEAHHSSNGQRINARTLTLRCKSAGLARAAMEIFATRRVQHPNQPAHVALRQSIELAEARWQATRRACGSRSTS